MIRRRILCVLLATIYISTISRASIADEISVEAAEPDIVSEKWFGTQNRFELAVFPLDFTFRNLYTTQPYAAHAAVGYHFFDWLAAEVYGGYVFAQGDTITASVLRENIDPRDDIPVSFWRSSWFLGGNLQWAPFYGKLSFFSEIEGNFQLYALFGTGVTGFDRAPLPNTDGPSTTQWSFHPGVGLRLFFTQFLAVRFEYRESFSANPLVVNDTKAWSSTSWAQFGISFFL